VQIPVLVSDKLVEDIFTEQNISLMDTPVIQKRLFAAER
jgi:hypothetical protein